MTNYTDEQLRKAWLAAALDEWNNPRGADPRRNAVRDDDGGREGDRDIITGYFAACGWSFHVPNGYAERGNTAWCGIFAGAMGRRVGDYLVEGQCVGVALDADVCQKVMPSTYRLDSKQKWRAAGVSEALTFVPADEGAFRHKHARSVVVSPEEVLLPGVIACVETSGGKPYGDHVVIVEEYDPHKKELMTVEGNGRGLLGDGVAGEGVVRGVRDLRTVRRVYHFGVKHFEILERP
jgi:hypothetical protein